MKKYSSKHKASLRDLQDLAQYDPVISKVLRSKMALSQSTINSLIDINSDFNLKLSYVVNMLDRSSANAAKISDQKKRSQSQKHVQALNKFIFQSKDFKKNIDLMYNEIRINSMYHRDYSRFSYYNFSNARYDRPDQKIFEGQKQDEATVLYWDNVQNKLYESAHAIGRRSYRISRR